MQSLLKRDENVGAIILRENFVLRAHSLVMRRSLFWKLGETFGTSSFYLSSFESILGSNIWSNMPSMFVSTISANTSNYEVIFAPNKKCKHLQC